MDFNFTFFEKINIVSQKYSSDTLKVSMGGAGRGSLTFGYVYSSETRLARHVTPTYEFIAADT